MTEKKEVNKIEEKKNCEKLIKKSNDYFLKSMHDQKVEKRIKEITQY